MILTAKFIQSLFSNSEINIMLMENRNRKNLKRLLSKHKAHGILKYKTYRRTKKKNKLRKVITITPKILTKDKYEDLI